MLGIGLPELVIILLVAVVLVRPRELPAIFRRLGALVGKLRNIRDGLSESLREAEGEITARDAPAPRSSPRESPEGGQKKA